MQPRSPALSLQTEIPWVPSRNKSHKHRTLLCEDLAPRTVHPGRRVTESALLRTPLSHPPAESLSSACAVNLPPRAPNPGFTLPLAPQERAAGVSHRWGGPRPPLAMGASLPLPRATQPSRHLGLCTVLPGKRRVPLSPCWVRPSGPVPFWSHTRITAVPALRALGLTSCRGCQPGVPFHWATNHLSEFTS